MKIAKVETMFAHASWNLLLANARTDEGIVGWGEVGLSGQEHAVMAAVRHLADLLER